VSPNRARRRTTQTQPPFTSFHASLTHHSSFVHTSCPLRASLCRGTGCLVKVRERFPLGVGSTGHHPVDLCNHQPQRKRLATHLLVPIHSLRTESVAELRVVRSERARTSSRLDPLGI